MGGLAMRGFKTEDKRIKLNEDYLNPLPLDLLFSLRFYPGHQNIDDLDLSPYELEQDDDFYGYHVEQKR